jgi:hypothetical protein
MMAGVRQFHFEKMKPSFAQLLGVLTDSLRCRAKELRCPLEGYSRMQLLFRFSVESLHHVTRSGRRVSICRILPCQLGEAIRGARVDPKEQATGSKCVTGEVEWASATIIDTCRAIQGSCIVGEAGAARGRELPI